MVDLLLSIKLNALKYCLLKINIFIIYDFIFKEFKSLYVIIFTFFHQIFYPFFIKVIGVEHAIYFIFNIQIEIVI